MLYEREMRFICDVFNKSHVRALTIPQHELPDRLDEYRAEGMMDPRFLEDGSIYQLLGELEHRTVYRLTDMFYRCFLCLLLPAGDIPTILFIGPYLSAPMSQQRLLMLGEEMGISPQKQRYLNEYYQSLPVVSPDGHMMIMFNTFCEWLWNSPSFAMITVEREQDLPTRPHLNPMSGSDRNDALVNMRALEQRYAFENQLLRSVSLGQLHMEDQLVQAFSADAFEKRAADPLRNAKNYGIIMNTLLRKAAEEGGVHPMYLDRTSSDFAHRIEKLPSLTENTALMCDMFRTYCRLVRRHATQRFSPVVRKAILMVDSDLSADLSPHTMAERLGVSLGHLSTVIRQETGQTLTGYVRKRRMEYAAHLLGTTDLQIQSVALHCGILDVQYFSKLFKKQYRMTPSEYRLAHKQSAHT